MIPVPQPTLYLLLVSAIRYALGRSTYIVGSTCETVRAFWPHMTEVNREVLLRDVEEELVRVVRDGRTLGMQMDHDEWSRLALWMRAHLVDPARGVGLGYPDGSGGPVRRRG